MILSTLKTHAGTLGKKRAILTSLSGGKLNIPPEARQTIVSDDVLIAEDDIRLLYADVVDNSSSASRIDRHNMSALPTDLQPDWEVISRMLWASSPEWTFGVSVDDCLSDVSADNCPLQSRSWSVR